MKFDTSVMQSSPAPRSRMDVPREPRTKRGRYVVIGAGGGLLIAVAALAMSLKLAAQQTQIDRLKAIAVFQENRVQSLVVHAGEHGVLQELALQPGQWVNGG